MLRVALSKIPEKLYFSTTASGNAAVAKQSKSASVVRFPSTGMSLTPYALYVKENYGETTVPKESTKAMKELSSSWKSLSDTEKEKYKKKSEEYRQGKISEFLQLSEDKQKKLIEEAKEQRLERAERRERKARREVWKSSGHPVIPPNSYALFIKKEMEVAKPTGNKTVTEIVKAGAKKWKELNETDKKKFNDEAKKLNDEYHAKLAQWKDEHEPKKERAASPNKENGEKKRSVSPANKKQ